MTTTVWKTVLQVRNVQDIEVPLGAELLCAREQHEQICIWYRCTEQKVFETRKITIVGTGHPAPVADQYLGTASIQGGELIFHVFVETLEAQGDSCPGKDAR